jgi:hypothetical protein
MPDTTTSFSDLVDFVGPARWRAGKRRRTRPATWAPRFRRAGDRLGRPEGLWIIATPGALLAAQMLIPGQAILRNPRSSDPWRYSLGWPIGAEPSLPFTPCAGANGATVTHSEGLIGRPPDFLST